jgi:hypothetical protein
MLLNAQMCLTAAAGVFSHLLIFIRGEHHVQASALLRIYLTLSLILLMGQCWDNSSLLTAAVTTGVLVITYVSFFFASVIIYRIFFHRLRRFPGPVMARVSKFWHVSRLLGDPNFTVLDELHQKYGDFVRTGKPHPVLVSFRFTHRWVQVRAKYQSAVRKACPKYMAQEADVPRPPSMTYCCPEFRSLQQGQRRCMISEDAYGIRPLV